MKYYSCILLQSLAVLRVNLSVSYDSRKSLLVWSFKLPTSNQFVAVMVRWCLRLLAVWILMNGGGFTQKMRKGGPAIQLCSLKMYEVGTLHQSQMTLYWKCQKEVENLCWCILQAKSTPGSTFPKYCHTS